MSKPNPNLHLKPQTSSLMASNPLMDSLTSHISLYHSSISLSNSIPNPRSSILKWFSSLTVHQRQASLTVVDHGFTQILLQMLGKLRTQGHGFFFILVDLPSRDLPDLPSLCFRKSRGLLARVSESNESERLIRVSIRMFGSKEGEGVEECSCSVNCLDTVTVSEEFVENVDRFVAAIDGVSNGGFLRGEENVVLGSDDWVEMGWLKEKGYYSIEAFVANRFEVALRLAWLNSNNSKKKGAKLKEKANRAGVAANVYWRKKGCVDWWGNLDAAMRKKVLTVVLAKAAKPLTNQILNGANRAMEDDSWLFTAGVEESLRYNSPNTHQRITKVTSVDAEFCSHIIPATDSSNPTLFANDFNSLFVLLDIVSIVFSCRRQEYDNEKLFYSTLGSVSTISDCIFRKLRGVLMVMSLDCLKLELLGEGNPRSPPNKCKEKVAASSRRKKGRTHNTKRLNPTLRNHGGDCTFNETLKSTFQGHRCGLTHKDDADHVKLGRISGRLSEKNHEEDLSSAIEMEHSQGLVDGKVRTAARKKRSKRNKTKISTSDNTSSLKNLEVSATESSSSTFVFQGEAGEPNKICDDSSVQNGVNNDSTIDHYMPKTSSHNTKKGHPTEESTARSSSSNVVCGCTSGSCHTDLKCHQYSDSVSENQTTASREGKLDNAEDCDLIPSVVPPPRKLDRPFSNKSSNFWNSGYSSENCTNSVTKATDSKEGTFFIKGQECGISCDTEHTSTSECLSYEWPSVAPVHISVVNSHIPAATDRLHLDVGRNWHNHFHHSFVPRMHQTRNPSIEGGCSRMVSRPLPMSLDWPPMVRGASGLAPSMACNYDYKFISRRQSSFQQAFTAQNVRIKANTIEDERKYFGDSVERSDPTNTHEVADDCDNHWISEEEYEVHAVTGMDYNQYFGGGVMYWDPSDHPGTGFSRPPSLSSDDSSWAWHETEMKRAVDDMVAFSSSYSTNGLTSPTSTSFCSPFDPFGTAHQALGYVMPGNEVTGKLMHPATTVTDAVVEERVSGNLPGDVEGKSGDSLPYPILPPIIIPNLSRERSRSEFKRNHEHKSPCVPPSRRDQPRIKRPPSPVVLCVPQAPRPPPPSPASDSRKQRGFPMVRSGSSSPRNWGVKGWYHDGANFEESCISMDGTEIFLPSWRNNNLSTRPVIHSLPGALLPDHLIAISQITRDQEHPDVSFPIQPPDLLNCPTRKTSLPLMQSFLQDEIDSFCNQVAAENMIRKPYINWAVKRVTRSLQVLWPRSRTNIFGSIATGLSLPSSDVDLVVCLPPVRNLEPIKEAGILEGRNGIKETCLQHAARYLANQEWVKTDSLKTVENTAIPIIMLVVEVPCDIITPATSNLPIPKHEPTWTTSEQGKQVHLDMVVPDNSTSPRASNIHDDYGKNSKSVRIDISFKSPSHTGVQTTKLVKELTEQFPAATPLALVLKQFLADRSLDQSYCGGLSSYCLVLLITRFLQHEHHLGRPINQNFGSLLMDFLYFFGNVFDPRQMRISVQGSGVYIKRERGYSIDPIHIDDPLFPTNNVGRNCFRIHQCIKAFSDAYSILESELTGLSTDGDLKTSPPCRLLPKIIPSIDLYRNFNDRKDI